MHVWRSSASVEGRPPLLLFSPSPYSGAYYFALAEALRGRREVIAIDTPGYGASARPSEPPELEQYVAAFADALDGLGLADTPIDVLGFHTGAMFAVELAGRRPDRVRKVVLSGVPYCVGEDRAKAYAQMVKPTEILEDGGHMLTYWRLIVNKREAGLALEQAQQRYNDFVPAMPYAWWSYHGLYRYPSERGLAAVDQSVLVLLLNEVLLGRTRESLALLKNATTADLTHLGHNAFDLGAVEIADVVETFLSETNAS